jgi:YegS/Rv2252/BmrU family lipid kinase
MNRIEVIINPTSGAGRGQKVWQVLKPGLQAIFDKVNYRLSTSKESLLDIATEIVMTRPDYLLAIGGDGSLSQTVNGVIKDDVLISPETQLALFNAGCGGDFMRQFQRQHVTDFLYRLKHKKVKKIDVGKISMTGKHHYFINVASCGLSGVVARTSAKSQWLKRFGSINYFIHAFMGLLRYASTDVTIQHDGHTPKKISMLLACICNGQYFGGKMNIAPQAKLDDGLLDVITFEDFSRIKAMFKLHKLYTGAHLKESNIHLVQAKSVKLSSRQQQKIFIEADGECVGCLPASFHLLTWQLPIVV